MAPSSTRCGRLLGLTLLRLTLRRSRRGMIRREKTPSLNTLFKEVAFRNAGVREALILSIASAYAMGRRRGFYAGRKTRGCPS